jgi:hypothetical protein
MTGAVLMDIGIGVRAIAGNGGAPLALIPQPK